MYLLIHIDNYSTNEFLTKRNFFLYAIICYNLYKEPTIKVRCLERANMEQTEKKNLTTNDKTQKNDKGALWINTIYKRRQENTIKNMSFKIFYQSKRG